MAYNQDAAWRTAGHTPAVWECLTHRSENSFPPPMVLVDPIAGYEVPAFELADGRVRRVFAIAGLASVILNDLYCMGKESDTDFDLPKVLVNEEDCSPRAALQRSVDIRNELRHTRLALGPRSPVSPSLGTLRNCDSLYGRRRRHRFERRRPGYGQRMSKPAALFDIDGTLVDTNYLHSLAWRRAFLEVGLDVATAAIHRRIGMGAGDLMKDLVGEARDDVKQAWRRHFDPLKPEVRAFPGAADLLRRTRQAGAVVVLASSSEKEDVETLVDAIDGRDAIDHITSAGDVDEAKPSPEVFEKAMEAAGGDCCSVLAVGDTVWDVEAAAKAGIGCVCVLTGGISSAELTEAGAVSVYRDVRTLLEQFDDSPLGRLLGGRPG